MKYCFLIGIWVFALYSCGTRKDSSEAHGHDHETHAHNHEAHDDHAAESELTGIEVTTLTPSPFSQVIKTSGRISAAQGDEAVAVATVAGVVSLNGSLTEGMSVGRGSTLLSLQSGHIAEGDPAQRARVVHDVAKREYDRMKALHELKIVSDKELAQAALSHDEAHIGYEALAKGHSKSGQQITSPLTGYVKSLLVQEGDYVSVGQPLVRITRNRRLNLRVEVSEKYYPQLHAIRTANFRLPASDQIVELEALNGRLLSFGRSTGDDSFYVPVTFEFDNKGDVIAGSFVEVYLKTAPMEHTLVVPRSSLVEEQGIYFVYLRHGEEGHYHYHKREVTLGADNGKEVQITGGLEAGDIVVTRGAQRIRLAQATQAIPAHSHNH